MLLLRVDDFPGTKPEEFWRHNLSNFKMFHEVVKKYVPSYLLGVIPKHTTNDDLQWLSMQMEIIVGLHGIEHREDGSMNEFPPFLTVDDVAAQIISVKQALDPFVGPIRTYMPPHNVIDARTIFACQRAGIYSYTTGPETLSMFRDPRFRSDSWARYMTAFHSEPPLEYGRSDELIQRGSVEHLRAVGKDRDVFLTLHWTWEWNIGLTNLETYLSQLDGMFADWSSYAV